MYLSVSICRNFHVPSLLEIESELGLSKHSLLTSHDKFGNISTRWVDMVMQDTTLCSVAFQLVVQCNRRNVDILEIDQSMCHRYRNGRTPHEVAGLIIGYTDFAC